jgi:hypothetical protein
MAVYLPYNKDPLADEIAFHIRFRFVVDTIYLATA